MITAAIIAQTGLPCFVKPNDSGSSFGVTKVKEARRAYHLPLKRLSRRAVRLLLKPLWMEGK